MSDTKGRILLVDDDAGLLRLLAMRLSAAGFDVATAESGEAALGKVPAFQPGLVITDLRMGGMDGMALFEQLHEKNPLLPIVILTAHGTIPEAVSATQQGVFAYLTKPFDSHELMATVHRAMAVEGAESAEQPVERDSGWRREIISRSPVMEELLERARRVAASDASLLIQSESGTGKELLASAIHRASPRSDGPFVPVNCSAIPGELLESELFGHVRGAFTGAATDRRGLFLAADGGTLFLDEIGDMPLAFQAKLLRAIQEKEVRRLGATRDEPVDVRIISATHQDLERAVAEGRFREDLYYRLNVVPLTLPPLRERREDIPLLADYFLRRVAERSGQPPKRFAPEARETLVAASWPGNIRQLLNVVEQTAILANGPIIPASEVERALHGQTAELLSLGEARDRFEHDYLVRLLQATQGNVSQAARLARRNRTEFYKLLHRHDLEPAFFRQKSGS